MKFFLNPNQENYLDECIHTNPIRHGRINLSGYLLNSYTLNIEKKVVSNHLSILPLTDVQKERLERIYRLHRRGYSYRRICDSMNKKYGATLTTNRPYYPSLIWGSLDKYKKRLKRMKALKVECKKVEFEKVEIRKTKSNLPLDLLLM